MDQRAPASIPLVVRRPRLIETATMTVAAISGIAGSVNYLALGQPLGLAAVAVALVGVALVRRWPWVSLAAACAAPLTGSLLGVDPLVLWSMTAFIVFAATPRGLPPLPAGTVAGVCAYLSILIHDEQGWLEPLALLSCAVAVAFAVGGSSLRSYQRYWEEVASRADEALATREAEAERRAAEERLRIAHDLHDTLGHEVALISMSVGAAEVHMDCDPAAARADLAEARKRIQSALNETQRVLSVLRDPAENAPAAGYGQIARLVEEFCEAGLEVAATIADEPDGIEAETSAAAYRIVQEALVNARKHGTGAVRLQVREREGKIRIEAMNLRAQPPPTPKPRSGFGLVGMRERAASAGGRIDVDEDDTRFALRASLPVTGRPA
ncbi:MAG: histidine kinase [Bifidobacteriaceae bacterium]|jgi:signal transduction histidine kinase|nr:histidine kinase [Bifidobacteriaceae bacterium]